MLYNKKQGGPVIMPHRVDVSWRLVCFRNIDEMYIVSALEIVFVMRYINRHFTLVREETEWSEEEEDRWGRHNWSRWNWDSQQCVNSIDWPALITTTAAAAAASASAASLIKHDRIPDVHAASRNPSHQHQKISCLFLCVLRALDSVLRRDLLRHPVARWPHCWQWVIANNRDADRKSGAIRSDRQVPIK